MAEDDIPVLTGNPADDEFAIGAGTGAKITPQFGDVISTYAWSITSKPSGSSATLSSTTAESPTFTVDKAGSYTVQLVVTDQHSESSSAATATISSATTVRRYWDGVEAVELRVTTLLPSGIFV